MAVLSTLAAKDQERTTNAFGTPINITTQHDMVGISLRNTSVSARTVTFSDAAVAGTLFVIELAAAGSEGEEVQYPFARRMNAGVNAAADGAGVEVTYYYNVLNS